MNNLPTVYWQIKKIKEIWLRKDHPQTQEMVKMFDETLREIETEHLGEKEEN